MEDAGRDVGALAQSIVGRSIGNYIVEKKLGEGGMGAVFLLRHTRLPSTFAALKVLLAAAGDRERMAARFEQEAHVAAAVGSHRVVKPLDVGEFEDGVPYIVMEYVDGKSLEAYLEHHGALTIVQALKIADRVADTMALAHERGIIHRDLKPANIMLAREGAKDDVVKLLDFGVARATGGLKVAHTTESVIIGTPGYMSPEAASGLAVDGRTDVFSLGVILYQMVTGELPFPSSNVQEAIVNVISKAQPPIARVRPAHLESVPPEVEAAISRALEKDPDRRLTMAQLHADLSRLLAQRQSGGGVQPGTLMSIVSAADAVAKPAPTLSLQASQVAEQIVRAPSSVEVPHRPDTDIDAVPGARRGRSRVLLLAGLGLLVVAVAGIVSRAIAPNAPTVTPPPATRPSTDKPTPTAAIVTTPLKNETTMVPASPSPHAPSPPPPVQKQPKPPKSDGAVKPPERPKKQDLPDWPASAEPTKPVKPTGGEIPIIRR